MGAFSAQNRRNEVKMSENKYYCPVNGWDCPYWRKDGSCTLENPIDNCADAAWWEDDEDYWEDEDM